jgi:8-oxo-dGTP diphosphatase
MEFIGVKVALFSNGKLVMQLRDNKPGLRFANMWDFPGGGREGAESPVECAIREIKEELDITLEPSRFIHEREYPAMHDDTLRAFFLVAEISQEEANNIVLGEEGQRWGFMEVEEFFAREDVVPGLKGRLKDYLNP